MVGRTPARISCSSGRKGGHEKQHGSCEQGGRHGSALPVAEGRGDGCRAEQHLREGKPAGANIFPAMLTKCCGIVDGGEFISMGHPRDLYSFFLSLSSLRRC